MTRHKDIPNRILRLLLPVIGILFFFGIPSLVDYTNNIIIKTFYAIDGQTETDSNIVIFEINDSDISSLGGWPLKRSYYALLIDNLTKLKVKNIGLEIFFSKSINTQNVYNNVLVNSIRKSNKVVLASLLENINFENNIIVAEKIDYPILREINSEIKTGHLNLIEGNGISIPSKVKVDSIEELSFSLKLSGLDKDEVVRVNFKSSWEKFERYSLLQFFEMYENNDSELTKFKDKIILIGVTDPLISKSISTNFDDNLPGVALHAFALDNILNGDSINDNYIDLSKYLFLIIGFLVSVLLINRSKVLFLIIVVFFTGSYLLWNIEIILLNYSAFIFPVFISFVGISLFNLIKKNTQLDKSLQLSSDLKYELMAKEKQLTELNNKLKKSNDSQLLKEQIDELKSEIKNLQQSEFENNEIYIPDEEPRIFEGIVYKSKKMHEIVSLIRKVAPENAPVLIQGESGSGKELVANAIHRLSTRNKEKIVAINCAALPENLLESELFGHVKGAFTDARNDKIGRFEEADNGTLFLDEIGETSENFQAKLLRVLQTGDFQKVGSSQTQHVDVRVVAATNKKLMQLVKEKKFREDLYYRLNVINIDLPPLSERTEDISVLAEYFVGKENPEMKISKAVLNKLISHEWKGNIRELEATIKRAVIFANSDQRKLIKLHDLPDELAKIDKNDFESIILESLREKKFSHSSINEIAKEFGNISRTIVSENFRGIFFKIYSQNNFNLESAVKIISDSDDENLHDRVRSKANKYLSNIEKDLANHPDKSFKELKELFNSKYKNLPQKFHKYLDLVIQKIMDKK